MDDYESLSHTKWDCKYHVVFIPKCRRKTLYVELRRHLGEVFRKLAIQKESRIEEGHLMPDHVHMMISIPPKYAVSQVIGFIKGKSAIHLARVYGEKKRNFVGQHFWARGYFVSTYGRDARTWVGSRSSCGRDRASDGPPRLCSPSASPVCGKPRPDAASARRKASFCGTWE
jgi:putative transposase